MTATGAWVAPGFTPAASRPMDSLAPDAHRELGLVLKAKGDLRGALAEFERALALQPDDQFSMERISEISRQLSR